jgi:hypothetical protein
MHAAGEHDDVQHTLLPLTFAVGLVRHRAYQDRPLTDQGREGDLNVLAGFIAAVVPIYEYALDARKAPRALRKHELEGGMFRDGAKELRFIDGRPPVRHMAVNATDVECVLALLRDPRHAAQISSRFVRRRAEKLRERSRRLQAAAAELRRASMQFRNGGERITAKAD